jgi:hypothetical protein
VNRHRELTARVEIISNPYRADRLRPTPNYNLIGSTPDPKAHLRTLFRPPLGPIASDKCRYTPTGWIVGAVGGGPSAWLQQESQFASYDFYLSASAILR